MKRILTVAALMMAQSAMAGWYTGFELNSFAESYEKFTNGTSDTGVDRFSAGIFHGYAMGVTSALEAQGLICLPSQMKAGQIAAIVAKYLKNNPETWNQAGETIIFTSISRTFPCKK
jgi:hypothetical protein